MDLNRRITYDLGSLLESEADPDPVIQLRLWIDHADEFGIEEPSAVALATVDATGRPEVRNLLLRNLDDAGSLTIFTNRNSPKGHEMAANRNVSLLFSWLPMRRQVRVSGYADLLDDASSDDYFASRPREAQIGAWASRQSAVLADRDELDRKVAEMHSRFGDGPIPRPPFWGGYLIRSSEYEFWQGRPNRLHDRLHYWRHGNHWRRERLAP